MPPCLSRSMIARAMTSTQMPAGRVSRKAASFTESVIREMTRVALEHNAVNLAQGFPDFPCPVEIKDAASAAIYADVNQYAITWGAKDFRDAIAEKTERFYPTWTRGSADRHHRDLRSNGGHDRGHAGAARSGRRGGRFRTFLRELRPGRDPVRRGATLRDAA